MKTARFLPSSRATTLTVVAAFAVVSTAASQQPDSGSARRLPALTVAAVKRRTVAPPVATRSVDSVTLERTQGEDPWDLVRRTTGIEIHEQGQGPGFASDAVLRGFTSDHSADVLFVLDGVPINLPLHGHVEGYSDWNILLPAAAADLRVILGPASPLYGDFAFGGVVEVTTATQAAGPTASLRVSSHGDAGGWFRTGRAGPRSGYLVAGRLDRVDGWRRNAGYRLGNLAFRGTTPIGRGRLEGGLLGYGSGWHSPGFLSVAQFSANQLSLAVDTTDGGHAERVIAHARYTVPLADRIGLSTLLWGQQLDSRVYLNIPEGDEPLAQTDEHDRRVAAGGEVQVSFETGTGAVSLGASGRADAVTNDLAESAARAAGDPLASYDGSFGSAALFGRWRGLAGPLALDVGLRLDAQHYSRRDLLAASPAAVAATHSIVSPKVGARYLVNGSVAVAASLSRGFRGAPGTIEDPTREPQRAWAKELALEANPGATRLRLAVFRLDVRGERIQDPITREITGAGRSVRQGIDAEAVVPLGPHFRFAATTTVNDATVSETLDASARVGLVADRRPDDPIVPVFHLEPLEPGDPVPGVSRYQARLGIDAFPTAAMRIGGLARLNGPFTPIGEPAIRTGSYLLVDLDGSVHLRGEDLVLDWELENLLDTKYPEVRSSGYLNPGTPRTVRVALRFHP